MTLCKDVGSRISNCLVAQSRMRKFIECHHSRKIAFYSRNSTWIVHKTRFELKIANQKINPIPQLSDFNFRQICKYFPAIMTTFSGDEFHKFNILLVAKAREHQKSFSSLENYVFFPSINSVSKF